MPGTHTVILGGGFGGIATARALRRLLPAEHRVTVVDRAPGFHVGAAKPWIMLGKRAPADLVSPRAGLLPAGVECVLANVTKIDRATRRVETTAGPFEADHLVIALGAELDLSLVPGLAESAQTFYTLEGAARLSDALRGVTHGDVVILVPRVPFKCPPAPYEAAFLLHDLFTRRGARSRVTLTVCSVEKAPMATAGPEMGRMIRGEMERRGIEYLPGRATASVDSARRSIVFEDGSQRGYSLLIAVPPHHASQVVKDAGLLAPGGWIAADRESLRVTLDGVAPHVYAIGDVNTVALPGRFAPDVPLALPKAGVFAASEGEVVASRIAAALGIGAPLSFDGRGYCYLETGGGEALRGEGAFFDEPHPVMSHRAADEAQYREKVAWVEEWLGRKV